MDNLDDDVLEILENIVEDSIKPRKRKNWRGFTLEDFKDYYQEHHQGKKRSQVRKEDSSFYDAVNRRKLNDEIFPSFNRWSKMSIEELKQYYMDNFDGKNRKEVKDDVENNGTAFHSGVRDRGLLDEVFPPTVVKPPRFWQNKTVEELIAYREEHFPGMSRKEIRNDKNNGGRAFISAVDRGGLRDKVLPPLEVKPSDYWRNFENIKLTIQPMIDELGRFPFKDEMAARNTSITASIQKYHGGVNAVRNAMGYSPHQRPVKYWMDPKNVKKELDVIIAEFGEFPTMPQILKKNPNLNQGIKDHHGIVEVRSWYGEKPLQKPRHYWKNFDHVEAEIREIETRLGHFPTSTELRGSGVMNGIQKYHGGLKTVKVKLGYANDELEVLRDVVGDCTPKPSGYWKIFANVRAALDLMITESGEFPSYTKIKNNNGSLAAAISKYHGGTNQVRKILGFGVIRKPNGYYSDQENIKRDLQQVIDKLGRFPSYPELNRLDGALLGGIEREHGGISTVREWYGETSPQKPDKYWKDPKHVMAALQPIIEKLGRFPLQTEIRETNQAIMGGISSHHGGLTEVRKWYNAERLEKPAGYWQDFDHVEEELGQIIDQLGRFPKQDELPSHLVNAIWRHHGGLTKVSKKCGFKYRKRPKKYWKDLDNVKAETDELIEKLGHFPNREELKNNNPALTSGLQKSHRGYTTLLEMYGKEEITTPRGYWEDFGNVKKELTPVINEIGKFPSYSELKDKNSRLLSAIEHRHGGISAVREKMGYLSKRKANGYWRSLEKVRTGLEPIVEELGKFPTAKEIQSRNNGLMHAIQRHHGGISAIKLRLGYANDELDILKQIVEDMQDEQL